MLAVTTLRTEAAKGNRNSKEGALNICSRRALGWKDSEEAHSLREDETVSESSRRTVTEEKKPLFPSETARKWREWGTR